MGYTLIDDAPKAAKFTLLDDYNPTEGNSFAKNALIGAGSAFAATGRGLRQVASKVPGLNRIEAFDPQKVQAEIDQAKAIDAPLMNTAGGVVGNVAGNAALLAPTALIPGANTYAGATAIGAITGALQPVASDESRLTNTAVGGAAGVAGKAIGDKVGGLLADRLAKKEASVAASQTQNAARDATYSAAKEAGYVVPPTQVNPSLANQALEGFAGKIKTGQEASLKNQKVTNELARKGLGIADDTPITKELLTDIRSEAGKAYEAIRGAGNIVADKQYGKDLARITDRFQGAAKDFPELAGDDIAKIVATVDKPEFSANSAVDAIGILRDKASSAYAKGDKDLGGAYRSASKALEDAIERKLIESGDDVTLKGFQDARKLIAKTYTVEKALNQSGNVNAQKLAADLGKGKPLSDELKTIAQFAATFKKAAQNVDQLGSVPAVSPLDAAVGVMTGGLPGAAWFVGRPAVRSMLLSDLYQGALKPNYAVGGGQKLLTNAANNQTLKNLLPALSANAALNFQK